ncbi:enteropeptidase-like [Thalassophryne amazonica]|uniref:enteropeptidase-like n=1 Tax=Thalassophryne amazonica TaxID=390379 RepID=UPI001470F775|nr:enteropeptidase-like [Thalassophryne amazonica]
MGGLTAITPTTGGLTALTPTTGGLTALTPTTGGLTAITPTTGDLTTITPVTGDLTTISPVTGACPPHQTSCRDWWTCIPVDRLCDGVDDCPDGSDEDGAQCATTCDGQFLLMGSSGSFRSANAAQPSYNSSSFCRWIIRVPSEHSVQIIFQHFDTEEQSDTLRVYEGVGPKKRLIAELSGSTSPGTIWLFSDQSTVEFSSDEFNNLSGFSATYRAANTSNLSNEQKLSCSFEQGMCLWRQQLNDDGYWIRINGPTFPPLTGPSVDHTFGNQSGFYLVTPRSPGQFLRRFRIHSVRLSPSTQPACLHFWSHMFGEDVHQLTLFLFQWSPSDAEANVTTVFQREGNFGDTWNYGQVTLNQTGDVVVVFEALKTGGMWNDIALDDITLTPGHCGPTPPDPTTVPPPTTAPPTPPDCGGPFELWEPNSTFTSPNYPQFYGNEAHCQWILHALKGRNIELHFLDFDLEATHDVVEVRDGMGPNSTFLGVFTGNNCPSPNLISTANQMTVWFFTDKSGRCRGFQANFTSGINLGSPEPCTAGQFQCDTGSCIHGSGQCDGVVDCPDASDEAECVILHVNGSRRLKFKLIFSLLTVCSLTWNSYLSNFTCQYLGYRSRVLLLFLHAMAVVVVFSSCEPCTAGQFQCDTGSCIHGSGQCDGVVDCPDASDEAECVILHVNGSRRLKFKLIFSLLTVCSLTWNSYLSNFTCQYLGYRSGKVMLLPALPEDSPFTNFSVGVDGNVTLSVSETCHGGHVVSLTCDNQPCGVRQVFNNVSVLVQAEGQRKDKESLGKITQGVDEILKAGGFSLKPWVWSGHSGRQVNTGQVQTQDRDLQNQALRKTIILPNQMRDDDNKALGIGYDMAEGKRYMLTSINFSKKKKEMRLGSNFVGSKPTLEELYRYLEHLDKTKVEDKVAKDGTEWSWKFHPADSPQRNGAEEAAVRLVFNLHIALVKQ